jgi:hypothetical protein
LFACAEAGVAPAGLAYRRSMSSTLTRHRIASKIDIMKSLFHTLRLIQITRSKNMKKVIFALACVIAMCSPAQAALVTFQYTAVVNFGATDDENGSSFEFAAINGYTIVPGNTVRGYISYDTSLPVWFNRNLAESYYKGGAGGMALDVVENGFSFRSTSADVLQMGVTNDRTFFGMTTDSFGFSSHTYRMEDTPPLSATFFLHDATATAFNSKALPSQLDLSRFQQANVILYYTLGANSAQFTANITSLALVNDVPEPSTLLSMGTALALLFAFGRYRTRNNIALN